MTELPTFRRTTLKIPRSTRPLPITRRQRATIGSSNEVMTRVIIVTNQATVTGVGSQSTRTGQNVKRGIANAPIAVSKATGRSFAAKGNQKDHLLQVQTKRLNQKLSESVGYRPSKPRMIVKLLLFVK